MEIWKSIKGYENIYEVSNHGRVRSLDRINVNSLGHVSTRKGCIMSGASNGIGYIQVNLSFSGKQIKYYIHRLVYITFIGEIEDGFEINHKDHDKSNNKLDNLEKVTKCENQQERVRYYNENYGRPTKAIGIKTNGDEFVYGEIKCTNCGAPRHRGKNKTGLCVDCFKEYNARNIPPREVLEEMISRMSNVAIGKIYNRSSTTIKKWLDKYNISRK